MEEPRNEPQSVPVREMAKQRYTLLSPRFWHGMTLPVWLKLLARNRFAVSPSRIPTAAAVTAASCLNTACAGASSLIYDHKVKNVEIKHPPLFIIGHWRAGTTLLHELLVLDPRHTFPNTCQCFAPSHFLLTEWLITQCLGFVMPNKRPMDNMDAGWRRPQEDEFALCNLGVPSPYLFMAYPTHGAVYEDYLTLANLPASDREAWQQAFLSFIKKLTHRDNRRIVLKSPPHTGRIRTLLEIFPDAKFIHLTRDPFALFPSTVRLWQSLTYLQSLRVSHDDSWLEEFVLDNFVQMYDQFESDRGLLDSTQFVELKYEDLVAEPKTWLKEVYNQLELGDYTDAEPAFDEYLLDKKDYRPNRHELEPAIQQKIVGRWGAYFDRYGYDRE